MLAQGITYNTTMALVAGIVPLLILVFARVAQQPDRSSIESWGWVFAALGLFLSVTGTHMVLTWPLAQIPKAPCCRVDNVTFGEPAMFYGYLILFTGIAIIRAERLELIHGRTFDLVNTVRPFLYAGAFGGFGLILIAVAGIHNGMWSPPPDEPIAGLFTGMFLEPLYIASAYTLTGVAAILAPFAPEKRIIARIFVVVLFIVGLMWLFIAMTVYYGHVGYFFTS